MFYHAFEAYEQMLAPLRSLAKDAVQFFGSPHQAWVEPWIDAAWPPSMRAAIAFLAEIRLTHTRPPFGIDRVGVGNRDVAVREEIVARTPFASLVHFAKDEIATPQPKVLIVAPLSGHFATLLRGTVRTMLPDHDVYITEWHDARDIPVYEGFFDLDDFIAQLISYMQLLGEATHVVAICQPAVAALAAVAIMSANGNAAVPRSLTLMAGPIDTRVNPTDVNRFATSRPIEWFAANVVSQVPLPYAGAWRPVYPGFVQLAAFMSLNMPRHTKAMHDLFEHMVRGETEKA
ncbi:MAG TPA: polyhydroxyalkanoate depolymerase, partial [Stellaceae bacterium]|nr:polyhydroxyalkanoate depolymerase [Stellaceae bacterium]